MFKLIALLFVVVVVAAVVWGVSALHKVTDTAVAKGLSGAVSSADSTRCHHTGSGVWTCTAKDSGGNRTGYRLHVRGHCFTAFKLEDGGGQKRVAHECLSFLHRLGL